MRKKYRDQLNEITLEVFPYYHSSYPRNRSINKIDELKKYIDSQEREIQLLRIALSRVEGCMFKCRTCYDDGGERGTFCAACGKKGKV